MIFLHEGNPGSGKSYDAVRRIIEVLKTGRKVYTNIDGLEKPEKRAAIAALVGIDPPLLDSLLVHLNEKETETFWTFCDHGSFIIIDEIHKWFNSRDWGKEGNRSFSDWASTHRHYGYDLCMLTQRASKVDTQVRSLCEWRYFYRRLNMFGSLFHSGYLCYIYSGDDSKPLSTKRYSYDPKIFKCYDSYKGNAIEKKVVNAPNILRHPVFIILCLVFAATAYLFSQSTFASGDILGVSRAKEKIDATMAGIASGNKPAGSSVGATSPVAPLGEGAGQVTVAGDPGRPPIPPHELPKFVWLPVSAYVSAPGREIVMVGKYRLSSWLRLSDDSLLVLVDARNVPAPVLSAAQVDPPPST